MDLVNYKKNRIILRSMCIPYAIFGIDILNQYLKENNLKYKTQIKSYLLENTDDDIYVSHHFYIEVKTDKGKKIIIDNEGIYSYRFYRQRYTPRHITIIKVSQKKSIQKLYLEETELLKAIKEMMLFQIDNLIEGNF